ncbi:class IV adenylate cyclase [Nocardiopsis aegyptia]|uniref:Adenylate cyclase class 2 n=1 Tax=Nocardiopsis aegyptia TaxID=220378 RepID=A0A7Z0EPG0_9ACTN|nr:class IV adenylate cyclase [Nocardiopsis aegyptia]NYJ35872.1 adenylate cyclase class 2 [Nocardiopsis aegyptia]
MSPVEVERKRELEGSAAEARARLAELGYRETSSFTEVDSYFSRPDVDFLETVECLRVRHRDGFAEITYKPASTADNHSHDGVITKRETNVLLQDTDQADHADLLLRSLGMVFLARVEKSRTSYRHPEHDDITLVLDEVAGTGVFLETEIISHDTDTAATQLRKVEDELGLSAYPVVSLPYRDLVLQRGAMADHH